MRFTSIFEWLLKILNFLLILLGLAMVGYGIYLFVEQKSDSSSGSDAPTSSPSTEFVQLGRPLLLMLSASDNIFVQLPKAWFIYLFTGLGVILVVVACCGCLGAIARKGFCLISYSVLVILLILVEIGAAAFIFFDKNWKQDIPVDRTGSFNKIYQFVEGNWEIIKWVVLGIVVLQVIVFVLAFIVRAGNKSSGNESDDEYNGESRQHSWLPFFNKKSGSASGAPAAGDQRQGRNDAWSSRMREKYGLDTSEFAYDPAEPNRNQQGTNQQEERKRCTIM